MARAFTFFRVWASSSAGKGRKTRIFTRPAGIPRARSASTVTLAVPAEGADEHQGDLGILHAVGLEQAVFSSGQGRELGGHLQNPLLGPLHGLGLLDLMLHIVAAQVIGTDGQGILRLEQEMLRAVLPHKGLDGVGIQQHNILQGVAGDKAILTDHHRQTDGGVLSDGHGLEEIVIGLLVVLRVNLNPPRVPDAHGVRSGRC